MNRWIRRAAAATAIAVLAGAAHAQPFPSKPLRFVVPFPAGSATDNVARIVAQAMGESLAQPVAVENKPGANGILGAEAVKAAAPDGYTMLVTTNTTQAANVSLYKKLSYDHGSAGALVSDALVASMGGLQVTPVAYKGIPPALTDLIGGSIQYAFADVGNAVAQMNGGKLKGLGVTTSQRASRAPNVPTIAEAALPGSEVQAWFGLVAPAGLAPDVRSKLSSTMLAVLARPDVREKIAAESVDVDPLDSAGLAQAIDAEIKRWAGWVRDANIQPE